MKEGLDQGHVERSYDTVEQRFLGDEKFIEQVEKKKAAEAVKIKIKFPRLAERVAAV